MTNNVRVKKTTDPQNSLITPVLRMRHVRHSNATTDFDNYLTFSHNCALAGFLDHLSPPSQHLPHFDVCWGEGWPDNWAYREMFKKVKVWSARWRVQAISHVLFRVAQIGNCEIIAGVYRYGEWTMNRTLTSLFCNIFTQLVSHGWNCGAASVLQVYRHGSYRGCSAGLVKLQDAL